MVRGASLGRTQVSYLVQLGCGVSDVRKMGEARVRESHTQAGERQRHKTSTLDMYRVEGGVRVGCRRDMWHTSRSCIFKTTLCSWCAPKSSAQSKPHQRRREERKGLTCSLQEERHGEKKKQRNEKQRKKRKTKKKKRKRAGVAKNQHFREDRATVKRLYVP